MTPQANNVVAPLAGAWIEIAHTTAAFFLHSVAPLAGAWIEIDQLHDRLILYKVAPLAGAWIEMKLGGILQSAVGSRSPRGSVD